jgi:hypothetical protein
MESQPGAAGGGAPLTQEMADAISEMIVDSEFE